MGNLLNIFGGGCNVSLYDATNGVLYLGALSDEGLPININPTPKKLSDGNTYMGKQITDFTITALESDLTRIQAITARRCYQQEVYFIGLENAVKITGVYLSTKVERSQKPGDRHKLVITGSTAVPANVTHYVNILGTYGAMDTATGGVATGWTNVDGTTPTNPVSFLGGSHGNCQRITFADQTDYIYCNFRFPLEQKSIKMTFQLSYHNYSASTRNIYAGFRTKDSGGSVLDTNTAAFSIPAGNTGSGFTETIFIPSAAVVSIDAYISGGTLGSIDVGIDEVQLEFGELSLWQNG